MNKKYDIIAVGMGPGAVFMAYELVKKNSGKKNIVNRTRKKVEKKLPNRKIGKCTKCKPFCNITSGFSGAGAFSDGKLSLYNEEDDDIYVGGELQKYIGVEKQKN